MKIRNKFTGQVHEVLEGTLYAENIFEKVTDEDIKVGEPKIEVEIEEMPEPEVKPKKEAKKVTKNTKKGVKRNGNTKTKSN